MTGARRPAVLLAALVFVLAAAGCGGGDSEETNAYVEQVNAAQQEFATTVERLSGRVTDESSTRQDRRTLGSFTAAVDEVVVDLSAIRPPESVAGLHAELVADMQAYADEVRSAASSLTSRDADADRLVASQQRLMRATDTVSAQINQAIGDINETLQSS